MSSEIPADQNKKMEDFCVLVEFPNDNQKVAVGHVSWLQIPNVTTEEIEKITDTEIKMRWPNCDISPPPKMISGTREIVWSEEIAVVKAQGNWVKMCQARITLETHGVPYINKNERSKFSRKDTENEQQSRLPSTTRDLSKSNKLQKVLKASSAAESKEIISNQKRKLDQQNDSDSSSDDEIYSLTKTQLLEKVKLQKTEIRCLKSTQKKILSRIEESVSYTKRFIIKNCHPYSSTSNSEKHKNSSTSNSEKHKKVQKPTDNSIHHSSATRTQKSKDVLNAKAVGNERTSDLLNVLVTETKQTQSPLNEMTLRDYEVSLSQSSMEFVSETVTQRVSITPVKNMSIRLPQEFGASSPSQLANKTSSPEVAQIRPEVPLISSPSQDTTSGTSNTPSTLPNSSTFKKPDYSEFKYLNHNTYTKLVKEMVPKISSLEEMATTTVSGRKMKTYGGVPIQSEKKRFDPEKIDFIVEYVQSHFKSEQITRKMVEKAVSEKLNSVLR